MNSKKVFASTTRLQDHDGHWYWIPDSEVVAFNTHLENLEGKDYMDDPDSYDLFSDKYEKYRTLGDPDNMPDYFSK